MTSTATSEEDTTKISKESVLDDVISDIDKLEKGLKSTKKLGDLLVLTYYMPSTLSKISLQLDVLRNWLESDGVFESQLRRNIAKRLG
jgi:hypothetical protein